MSQTFSKVFAQSVSVIALSLLGIVENEGVRRLVVEFINVCPVSIYCISNTVRFMHSDTVFMI